MDWTAKEAERKREIEEERKRLIALTDGEAESLPVPERYQRIRYLCEIEANAWMKEEQRKVALCTPLPDKPRYSKQTTTAPKKAYKSWND